MITMLKSKLHRAVVTEADVNYVGSITIDKDLMEKSGIYEYEKVSVVDVENGQRFDTYVIAGESKETDFQFLFLNNNLAVFSF